ncbi:hypothetical protein J6590_028676, partial [Homalodisca vitripennis]
SWKRYFYDPTVSDNSSTALVAIAHSEFHPAALENPGGDSSKQPRLQITLCVRKEDKLHAKELRTMENMFFR